jgi:hypothetical protein
METKATNPVERINFKFRFVRFVVMARTKIFVQLSEISDDFAMRNASIAKS